MSTLNPADKGFFVTLSNGNLTSAVGHVGDFSSVRGTASTSSGTVSYTATLTAWDTSWGGFSSAFFVGFGTAAADVNTVGGSDTSSWGLFLAPGGVYTYYNGDLVGLVSVAPPTPGSTVTLTLDLDAGSIAYSVVSGGGTHTGVAFASGVSGTLFPFISNLSSTTTVDLSEYSDPSVEVDASFEADASAGFDASTPPSAVFALSGDLSGYDLSADALSSDGYSVSTAPGEAFFVAHASASASASAEAFLRGRGGFSARASVDAEASAFAYPPGAGDFSAETAAGFLASGAAGRGGKGDATFSVSCGFTASGHNFFGGVGAFTMAASASMVASAYAGPRGASSFVANLSASAQVSAYAVPFGHGDFIAGVSASMVASAYAVPPGRSTFVANLSASAQASAYAVPFGHGDFTAMASSSWSASASAVPPGRSSFTASASADASASSHTFSAGQGDFTAMASATALASALATPRGGSTFAANLAAGFDASAHVYAVGEGDFTAMASSGFAPSAVATGGSGSYFEAGGAYGFDVSSHAYAAGEGDFSASASSGASASGGAGVKASFRADVSALFEAWTPPQPVNTSFEADTSCEAVFGGAIDISYPPFAGFEAGASCEFEAGVFSSTAYASFEAAVASDCYASTPLSQGSGQTPAHPNFWGIRVHLAGDDITPYLTGSVTVHTSENAAATAEFSVIRLAGPVDVAKYVGLPVKVWYRPPGDAEWHIRFTGIADTPDHDTGDGVTKVLCTDGLQLVFKRIAGDTSRAVAAARHALITAENRRNAIYADIQNHPSYSQAVVNQKLMEAEIAVTAANVQMAEAQTQTAARIKALVGGRWSRLVFQPGASGWDTFTDIMSTQRASYALASDGVGYCAPWAPKPVADFFFTDDDFVAEEGGNPWPRVDYLVNAGDVVNSVDLRFEYRFTRLFEYSFSFAWNPGDLYAYYATLSGVPCPDYKTVASAASGTGLAVMTANGGYGHTLSTTGVGSVVMRPIPAPGPVTLDKTWLGYLADNPRFSCVGAAGMRLFKRYTQSVTEIHLASITAPNSMLQTGRMNKEMAFGAEASLIPDAVLSQIVEHWEEQEQSTATMQISSNGVSVQAPEIAAGNVADTIIETEQVPVNRYLWDTPAMRVDNTGTVQPITPDDDPEVGCTVNGATARHWNITYSWLDGREEFVNAYETAKEAARTTITASHRGNQISFTVEAHPTLELYHTVQAEGSGPAFYARGKVKEMEHTFNIDTGAALTKVSVALVKSWATGAHYADPYIPPQDQATIIYRNSHYNTGLLNWPQEARNLAGVGSPEQLSRTAPPGFRGYNWWSGDFVMEAPPTPPEAQPNFTSLVKYSEAFDIQDDSLTVDA